MRRLSVLALIAVVTLPGCSARSASIAAAKDTLYTSTRYVRAMAAAPDGSIWVATMGGVLRRAPDGTWTKFTQMDGLPSCEALGVAIDGDKVKVELPTADAVWEKGKWTFKPAKHVAYDELANPAVVVFRGREYRTGGYAAVPGARSSVVGALLVKGDQLWAAVYDDGIWAFDGKSWKRAEVGLPEEARDVTAMLFECGVVWAGTRGSGVWEYDGKSWKQHLQPDEPPSSDCVAVAMYRGQLFVATLNNGLMTRSAEGWQSVKIPEDSLRPGSSSDWPKSMMGFDANLYVLQGNGAVDRFDGTKWEKNVFSALPRGSQVSVVASDDKRIYAGQWGGWSEFDGKTWMHRLKNPSMQGHQVTCLLPDGETLWVGLQGLGLAQMDESSGDITWHDERNGLPDDWVTCMVKVNGVVYAGTFDGGLAYWDGKTWAVVKELAHQKISDIAADGKGGVLVATISGVWRFADGRLTKLLTGLASPDKEASCLCVTDEGLWVGTRTGIYFASGRNLLDVR